MLIQEFCRATGLTRDTVRFYVRQGLLAPTIGAPARSASAGATTTAGPTTAAPMPAEAPVTSATGRGEVESTAGSTLRVMRDLDGVGRRAGADGRPNHGCARDATTLHCGP